MTSNEDRDIEAEVAASLAAGADLDSVIDKSTSTMTQQEPEMERQSDADTVGGVNIAAAESVIKAASPPPLLKEPEVTNAAPPTLPSVVDEDLAGELERVATLTDPPVLPPPHPSSVQSPGVAEQPTV